MKATMIDTNVIHQFLMTHGWIYKVGMGVFYRGRVHFPKLTQEISIDDSRLDFVAEHTGLDKAVLIEELQQRMQRQLDAKLDPQKAPKINSEKIIWPEALNIWMARRGWSFDANQLCFTKPNDWASGFITPRMRALHVPRPASDPYFLSLAENLGTPHAELVDALYEWTQELRKNCDEKTAPPEAPKINSEKLFDPDVLWTEEPVRHVPDSHVETVVSALRNGIEYARIALKDLPAKALSPSRLEKHVTSAMEADIAEMQRALSFLGADE